jgi:methylthioribose-1-phosphate isomerase
MTITPTIQAVGWNGDECVLVDQTKLPGQEVLISCRKVQTLIDAIQALSVRGAPALGVAGAYGTAVAAREVLDTRPKDPWHFFDSLCEKLAEARPTAVNLRWGVERARKKVEALRPDFSLRVFETLLTEAKEIHSEDHKWNEQMAKHGAALFNGGAAMTVCNTGDLCTGGIGTAFGVLREAFFQKRIDHVYALETRPLLQGLRLTAWELARNNIDYTIICDNMAASVMRDKRISGIVVGADRIVANGDFANKIGTYMLAVLAKHHRIPFYVAAPSSTFDPSLSTGKEIPIEERKPEEILSVLGTNRPEAPFRVFNPAFDVTPHELVTGIICEKGTLLSPNAENVSRFLGEKGVLQ